MRHKPSEITSEALLEAVQTATNEGILIIGLNGEILAYNEQFLKIWEIPEHVVERANDQILLSNVQNKLENWDEFINLVNYLYDHPDVERLNDIIKLKSGKILSRNTKPVKLQQNKIVARAWIFSDVSEIIKAHKALKESELRYRTLFNSAPIGIVVLRQSKIVFANKAFIEMLGYKDPGDVIENLIKTYQPADIREMLEKRGIRREQGYKEPTSYDTYFLKKDGSKFPVHIEVDQINLPDGLAILGFIDDITERKNAEKALRLSEERYRKLVSHSVEAIYMTDATSLRILDANPAFLNLLGYTREELSKLKIYDFVNHDRTDIDGYHNEILSQKKSVIVGNRKWKRKDGTILEMYVTAYKVSQEDRTYLFIVAQDLTERNYAEKEKERLHAQIQHTQKLESLGILAGGIAHDFNNILVGILGNVSIALSKLPSESPILPIIKSIENSSERAAELTQQMLAYSGKGQFVKKVINLSNLIQDMHNLIEISISKNIKMTYKLSENLPLIEIDVTQIRQVVLNLITNASEAIGEKNGTIEINSGIIEADKNYLADVYVSRQLQEAKYLFIGVSDSGQGMDKQTLDKIFDPFFTTKFTGRGLGLAVVLGIIRGHNGGIKIKSEIDQGTSFTILLPYPEEKLFEIEEKITLRNEINQSGLILLCDDEEIVRSVAEKMLIQLGFDVIQATNGQEAIQIVLKNKNEIDLVILDMTMPIMSGLETFLEMRRIKKDLPILLSSGFNEQEFTDQFAGYGMWGFVQKPYTIGFLESKIAEIFKEEH